MNDIVLTHSLDATGTTWSSISRVPTDATNSNVDHFILGLAVNRASSGGTAQLGMTYYYYPAETTSLSVGFVSSSNAGASWSGPQTVQTGMSPAWAASTSQGRMVGDYISTSYGSDNQAHGVYGSALTPTTGASTTCTTAALDNCNAPISASAGLAAASTVTANNDPVLFTGNGGTVRPVCGTSWPTSALNTATDPNRWCRYPCGGSAHVRCSSGPTTVRAGARLTMRDALAVAVGADPADASSVKLKM